MSDQVNESLEVPRKIAREKIQERVWCNKELYQKFKKKLAVDGVLRTDFYEQCMRWYLEGKIK